MVCPLLTWWMVPRHKANSHPRQPVVTSIVVYSPFHPERGRKARRNCEGIFPSVSSGRLSVRLSAFSTALSQASNPLLVTRLMLRILPCAPSHTSTSARGLPGTSSIRTIFLRMLALTCSIQLAGTDDWEAARIGMLAAIGECGGGIDVQAHSRASGNDGMSPLILLNGCDYSGFSAGERWTEPEGQVVLGLGPYSFSPGLLSRQRNTRFTTGKRIHQPLRPTSCILRIATARPGTKTARP